MSIHKNPVQLLQTLIRFNTTNLPGDEAACMRYLDGIIQSYGIETTMLALDDNRPNLIARIAGTGDAPPLVLQGHLDVVPTTGQDWTYPPFSAEIHDGFVWGRGALDMKGGVTMMVCAFLALKASGKLPAGDIILCLLSDEERGGTYGAKFLTEQHREIFGAAKYSIGEFGGFPLHIGGQKLYPIQISERGMCATK
ncbi:MAG TPA: M20/M25/M40 family metallo-hydrolase, partial [Anaerolineae bacterium]|nr:M20/M25/M40 family metallo-hydrolase [Anaerolineae bacterium]